MTPVEQIKEKLDIVELIRSYVQLLPSGKNFKANCPFHKEKTPSFMVSPERQTWHCFGSCSEGGDIFKFVMKYENIEFYEALRLLAERAGIELRKNSTFEQRQFEILYEIIDSAKDFFKKNLQNNPEILDYLKNRGLKKETIEEFEIGFSPNEFDKLTLFLIKQGFDVKNIERAGINFKTDRGGYIDRFRGRIMFPIYNHFGKAIGFSGRILPKYDTGETGKYINSPETPIFNKSKILYGFHNSKNHIREQKYAVLMEGQMDFLMSCQDGIKNAVATSGTALTIDHLKVLKKYADNLVFCFDNDEAGLKAAERSIDLALSLDFNVKILIIDGYKDPAELVQNAPGRLLEFLKDGKSIMEFYFDRYFGGLEKNFKTNDISNLKSGLRNVLKRIKNMASPVEKAYWIKEISNRLNLDERAVFEEMENIKNEKLTNQANRESGHSIKIQNNFSRRDLIAQRILALLYIKNKLQERINDYMIYLPQDYISLVEGVLKKTKFLDERLLGLLNSIIMKSSIELEILGEENIDEEFQNLSLQLKKEYFKEKKDELMRLIKNAEKNGNEKEIDAALIEFDNISKLMQN